MLNIKTNAFDYALTAILSIMILDNKVYLVAFHFCTFNSIKLKYNTYNKEFLAIFEAF